MRPWLAIAVLVLAPAGARAQINPASLPAKDQHQDFLAAADPYVDASRAKREFEKADPIKAGILAIEVFFHNDTKEPIHVNLQSIRLEVHAPGAERFRLRALSAGQAASEIAYPKGTPSPGARRLPPVVPFPRRGHRTRGIEEKLQSLGFQSDIVPPAGTIHGFLFFDVNHEFGVLPYASLYIPDVKSITNNRALIYFEVPLRLAVNH